MHAVRVVELLYSRFQFNEASGYAIYALAFAAITLKFTTSMSTDPALAADASHVARSANGLLLSLSNQNPAAAELSKALLAGPNSDGYQAPAAPVPVLDGYQAPAAPLPVHRDSGYHDSAASTTTSWWNTFVDDPPIKDDLSSVDILPHMDGMDFTTPVYPSMTDAEIAATNAIYTSKIMSRRSGLQSGVDPTWSEPHILSTLQWPNAYIPGS